jgi:hypothetical protein
LWGEFPTPRVHIQDLFHDPPLPPDMLAIMSSWCRAHTHSRPQPPIRLFQEVSDKREAGLPEGAVHPWAPCNRALMLSYLSIGIAEMFAVTPATVYAVETLDASPARVSLLATLMVRVYVCVAVCLCVCVCVRVRACLNVCMCVRAPMWLAHYDHQHNHAP